MKKFNVWIARRPIGEHTLAVACLVICTIIYTWPLLSHLTTVIPGLPELTDVTEYLWSVGWVRFAVSHGFSMTYSEYIFVPFGADLRLNTQQLLQALIALPFTGLLGVQGAYNLVLILTYFLNGILAYFFTHSLTRSPQAALLAATCFMMSGVLAMHFNVGRSALTALWIVIAMLWCTKSLLETPTWFKGILLGGALLAASFTDFHTLLFSMAWLVMYLAHEFFRNRAQLFGREQLIALSIALLVWSVPFAAFYLPVLVSAPDAGYFMPRLVDMVQYSYGPADYADPEKIPYLYGYDLLCIVLAAVMVFRWRGEYRFWLVCSFFLLFLTLGPYLKPYGLPLPYTMVSWWPALMQFRAPYRFVLPALIGWAVIAAYLFAHFLPRIPGAYRSWGLVLILIAGRLSYANSVYPYKTQVYPDYYFYHWVADVPGDFTILEIPFGVRTGLEQIGDGAEAMQYYQHIHWKHLLNSSVSRLPASIFEFYRSQPALMFLAGEATAEREVLDQDFADVLKWSNSRYAVVHRSLLPADYADQILTFLEEQPQLQFVWLENDLIVYEVP